MSYLIIWYPATCPVFDEKASRGWGWCIHYTGLPHLHMRGGFLEPALPLGYATLPSQLFFASLFLLFFLLPFPPHFFYYDQLLIPDSFLIIFHLTSSLFFLFHLSFPHIFHPFMFFITLSCLFYIIPPPFLNFLHAYSLFSFSLTFSHS